MKNAMTVESNDKNKGRYDFMSPIFSYVFSGIAVLAVVYLIFFMFRLINASAEKETESEETESADVPTVSADEILERMEEQL